MHGSRLRPLICVGLAYFLIAVLIPGMLYPLLEYGGTNAAGKEIAWTTSGFVWSLAAGAAGAIGALGIILAFTHGGKPAYVMPLVFGGAPIVNTFFSLSTAKEIGAVSPVFIAGLIIAVIGAVCVLVFAPKAGPHAAPQTRSQPAAEPPSRLPPEQPGDSAEAATTPPADATALAPQSLAQPAP
jgi:peptidoglycan/LPS O-acetylase OafA/YrhL